MYAYRFKEYTGISPTKSQKTVLDQFGMVGLGNCYYCGDDRLLSLNVIEDLKPVRVCSDCLPKIPEGRGDRMLQFASKF